MTDAQKIKIEAIALLRSRLPRHRERLLEIDARLLDYFDDVATNTSADPDDENDRHNVYEVLCSVRFLRLLDTYNFNRQKVQAVIRLREGEWRRDGKTWRHVSGGLKCPGTTGAQVYRWQPFQVFVLASVFGFYSWIDTEVEAGTKAELLPTEREKDGTIYDYRRLCTDFTYFAPRKTDKTGLAAFIQLVFFFLEDDNAECYCCSNSASQSALLFSRTRAFISQLDDGARIRSTQTVIDWRESYKSVRNSSVRPLSAGGKTKDGMFAQLCCADEFGSAPYANGKSDMLALVNVIQSSMGPRREPMTFITTTAGTITSGPFIEKLDALHAALLKELDYIEVEDSTKYIDKTTGLPPDFESDRRLCLCLEPDDWECEEGVILTKKSLRIKVNPMLGRIVQHASYDGWISEARGDKTKMPELVAKYFNHYTTDKVKSWVVTADDIRRLQCERKITDCRYSEGWSVFVGLDFSSGDDLFAMSFLAVNYSAGLEMKDRFFADTYLWILEHSMQKSPNRPFYEQLIEKGYLRECPGKVFNPDYAINELMSLNTAGVNLVAFGYDPAQSHDPINTIKAWLQTVGMTAAVIKDMVIPVNQGFMTMNPLVQKFERMCLSRDPWLQFSDNPLWPWMVGNVVLVYSRDETLCRPQKSGDHKKIDGLAALLDAIAVFDLSEGKTS